MKKIVKKNQVVLTVLAVMIAVAGYLTYAGNDGLWPAGSGQKSEEAGISGGLDEEVLGQNVALENAGKLTESAAENGDEGKGNSAQAGAGTSGQSGTLSSGNGEQKEEGETPDSTPGEAVLTNAQVVDFMARVQLSREQVRTKNKESLMEIINSTALSDEEKKEAVSAMVELTDVARKENATETLLAAKGFENTVVSIDEDGVDVVIGRTELSDAERAQIEDIVKRKAEVPASAIVITLMTGP